MTATDILRRPIEQNHAPGAATIGSFLAELLARLIETDTDFDPDHPFATGTDEGPIPVSITHWTDDLDAALGDQHTFADLIVALTEALTSEAGVARARMTVSVDGREHVAEILLPTKAARA